MAMITIIMRLKLFYTACPYDRKIVTMIFLCIINAITLTVAKTFFLFKVSYV